MDASLHKAEGLNLTLQARQVLANSKSLEGLWVAICTTCYMLLSWTNGGRMHGGLSSRKWDAPSNKSILTTSSIVDYVIVQRRIWGTCLQCLLPGQTLRQVGTTIDWWETIFYVESFTLGQLLNTEGIKSDVNLPLRWKPFYFAYFLSKGSDIHVLSKEECASVRSRWKTRAHNVESHKFLSSSTMNVLSPWSSSQREC